MFDEQQFDQAIDVLTNFATKLRGTVEVMKSEAETCKVNMEGDTNAENASNALIAVLDRIIGILDGDLQTLLSQLEEEKERAIKLTQDNEYGEA